MLDSHAPKTHTIWRTIIIMQRDMNDMSHQVMLVSLIPVVNSILRTFNSVTLRKFPPCVQVMKIMLFIMIKFKKEVRCIKK